MSQELTTNLMAIVLRNGIELWLEKERAENLMQKLEQGKEKGFVRIDNQFINVADVIGIFSPETMQTKEKVKQGQWQCQACKRWHPRGEQCGCAGGKY